VKEGEDFEIFVEEVLRWLPKSVSKDCLFESLRHLAGEKLTRELLDETCWRIAGNLDRLKGRMAVFPWSHQPEEEWVPVQILSARRRRGGRGKPGWQFTFHILAGLSCTLKIQKFWSTRFCNFLARDMGFNTRYPSDRSSRVPEYMYLHPTEFINMRLLVLIDPKQSKTEPVFAQTGITPQLLEWNREQMRYRDRIRPGYVCPRNYPVNVKCYRCPAGYKSCRAGTHKEDYLIDHCEYCGFDDAAYDPDVSTEMCLNCYNHRALKRD